MTTPPASVIVLSFNTCALTLQCLSTFGPDLLDRGWQVILVDNASSDATVEIVSEHFSYVDVIRSERNLGFAGGNNLGLRRATGDCVFLINSDVIATADTLQALAHTLQSQTQVGAMSPGLITPGGVPQAFAFGSDPTPGYLIRRGLGTLLRREPMHRWDIEQPIDADWVSGACLCIRKATLEQVGLLDERFKLYFEDSDWCMRMRQAGWRVVYDPRFKVIHLGGASLPQRRDANQLYYRSMIQFYAKHYGTLSTTLLRLLLLPYTALMARRR